MSYPCPKDGWRVPFASGVAVLKCLDDWDIPIVVTVLEKNARAHFGEPSFALDYALAS